MIKKYTNEAAYSAAGYPTTESRVSQIATSKEVKIDGVNVKTDTPVLGDACYKYGNSYCFFKGGSALNNTLLTANGYVGVGQVIGWKNGKVAVVDKTISSAKYLDVCQYSITAISSTSLVIKLRMSPDYAVDTTVNVTLTSATMDETSAAEISTAVEAAAQSAGDTKAWWAYLADNNDNKVESGGTKIIIQCDTCVDYRFYICSATGCTITHTAWGDMPESSWYLKIHGATTNYCGLMNIDRGYAYWSTSGRVPTANEGIRRSGNDNPVTLAAFTSSDYCQLLRDTYGTYREYLIGEYGILYPQNFGCFALPNADTLTKKYGNKTAPTKDGGTKYKYPALHYPLTVDYGVSGLSAGDMYLNGISDGMVFMKDENLSVINATRDKMGHSAISNGAPRWFAQRYSVTNAWIFHGNCGTLDHTSVLGSLQVQAVALLKP